MYYQNQFNNFQQNLNENDDPPPINNEEDEKEYKGGDKIVFALKRNFISKYLIEFCKNEKNKKLDEMLSDLISYKIYKKTNEPFNLRQIIFEKLEKMMIELSCLRNEEIRMEKIIKLFLWYKERIKSFEDIRKIQEKSYKEKDEIDDLEIYNERELKKKSQKEDIIINEEEKNVKEDLKHRNKDILYKDMLEDYKLKQIKDSYNADNRTKSNKELDSFPKKNDKALYKTLSSSSYKNYSHMGEITTFYSTKNGKNAFTLKKKLGIVEQTYYSLNKRHFPKLNRETKFSYSYNRPPYDYNTMIIENNIINNKLKNLKEKRGKEEINEGLDNFGMDKAKFKENIINKYELKKIINMYTNDNNFNSALLKKYKLKKPIIKKEIKLKSISNKKSIDDNLIYNNEESKENFVKIRNDSKRSFSQVIKKVNILNEKSKIDINQIKNIDLNTNSIMEREKNEIKVIKIKLKQTKDKIKKKYINIKENYSNIPNDIVYNIFNKNPLFKQKFLYDRLCGIKAKKVEISNKDTERDESESEYHNFYMSAYDFSNLKKLENYEVEKKKKTRNNEKNIIEAFDSSKDDYLNFRKTMSSWKKNNFEKLYNRIIKNKDNNEISNFTPESKYISFKRKINIKQEKHNSLEYALVNPIENSLYPRLFLPRNGSMLLTRKAQNEKKGKSKKKKK